VSAQCIDGGSALANQQITAPVGHQNALLFFALDRNKPQSGPLNRLAAYLGIGGIVFVGLDVCSDIAHWHQPGVMTQFDQLARPEMRPTASLQPDHAWCEAGKELKHLSAGELAAEHDLTTLVDTGNLKLALRRVQPDRYDYHLEVSSENPHNPLEVSGDRPSHYLRFTLSYRDVEELLSERGLDISHETVRRWVLKFGCLIAQRLRRKRPRPSDSWHLNEMVVRIAGERMYRRRAVDHDGEVLDILVQRRRDSRGRCG
jgi:DDE domain